MKISPQLIIDIYVNTQWGEMIFEGGFIIFWKGVSDLETRLDYSYLHARSSLKGVFSKPFGKQIPTQFFSFFLRYRKVCEQ